MKKAFSPSGGGLSLVRPTLLASVADDPAAENLHRLLDKAIVAGSVFTRCFGRRLDVMGGMDTILVFFFFLTRVRRNTRTVSMLSMLSNPIVPLADIINGDELDFDHMRFPLCLWSWEPWRAARSFSIDNPLGIIRPGLSRSVFEGKPEWNRFP